MLTWGRRTGCGSGTLTCAALALQTASFWLTCSAFPTYPKAIPSGTEINCPEHFSAEQAKEQCVAGLCAAIGHKDCRGGRHKAEDGTFLNAFGEAFRDAGYQWTAELCAADSDGDGRTNGEELGDPCCVWLPGQPLPMAGAYETSHPGLARDTTAAPVPADCDARRAAAADAAGGSEMDAIDALFADGEERRELTFEVAKHTLLPNETVYTNVFFPVPQAEELYIRGFLPSIDNTHLTHHLVAYLCVDEMAAYTDAAAGVAVQPQSAEHNGYLPESCQRVLYGWAPGGDDLLLPDDVHIYYGKGSGYKTVLLEIHYNNLSGATDEVDASGFKAYASRTPRAAGATFWWLGTIEKVGTIPPGSMHYSASECRVRLRPGCDSVNIVASVPHTHITGVAIWSEIYERDTAGHLSYVQDLSRDMHFSFYNQYTRTLPEPMSITDGQLLSTVCVYNTAERTQDTLGGLGSLEEMCLHAMLTYPENCLYGLQCGGAAIGGEVPPDADVTNEALRTGDVYTLGSNPDYAAIAAKYGLQCNLSGLLDSRGTTVTADTVEQLWAAMGASCPDVSPGEMEPEKVLAYDCPQTCVDFLLNLGVCAETDSMEEWDAIALLGQGQTPLTEAPPSCYRAVTQAVSEMAPVATAGNEQALQASSANESSKKAIGILAALSAVALIFLMMTLNYMRGASFPRRGFRPVFSMPFSSRGVPHGRSLSKNSLGAEAEQQAHYLEVEHA